MSANILIADDEEIERRAIRMILEGEPDLQIFEAENGVDVLDAMTRIPVTVALLDIKMPGLDGIAVAERLRSEYPDVGIVFLTAYDQFDYARSALRLQVDDFLLKPASAAEVVATVRKVLNRVASREGERQSSRAALYRLDSALNLVAQKLRDDLSQGLPDGEQILQFLDLQGMEGQLLTLLDCRPAQPCTHLSHVAKLAETWFSVGETVALAGVQGQTVRIMRMGEPDQRDPLPLISKFRETARSETGCSLLIGAARAATSRPHPDALVTAAHRAAALVSPSNPVLLVSVGAEEKTPTLEHFPPLVSRVLDILEQRMAEDLSLNEVAALVGLSPSHLSRQLARATGKGFADCLAHFRIAGAKKYLASGNLSVKEVAHLVGFHDPAYFARVFRRLEGRSPADYRADAERRDQQP